MAPTYRISIIQLYSKPLDPTNNLKRASLLIRQAAQAGTDLAILPEYHLTSWAPADPSFQESGDAWEEYLNAYKALAVELKICIVPGTMLKRVVEGEEEKLYNVCCFIDGEGVLRGEYAKKNLWHTERSTLAADTSTPHTVFDTPLGPIGLLICWDLAFPEAWRGMIAAGAKIIIVPAYWLRGSAFNGYKRNADSETLHLNSLITARAYENTCAVVFVNAGGPTKEMIGTDLVNEHTEEQYGGVSQVAVPFVGPVERIDGPEEGWKTAEVDMEILEEAEMDYRIRKDLKTEGWHYVLQDGGGKDKAKVRVGE